MINIKKPLAARAKRESSLSVVVDDHDDWLAKFEALLIAVYSEGVMTLIVTWWVVKGEQEEVLILK